VEIMAEIDKDMWQRQEDINTVVNFFCGSEEVAKYMKSFRN